MADKLNISRTAVGKWETENAYPDVEKLIMLAKIYDCSIDYLLGLSNNVKVISKNEIVALKAITSIALKENIIASGETITNSEIKKLTAEIETAYLAYMLFKRINKHK